MLSKSEVETSDWFYQYSHYCLESLRVSALWHKLINKKGPFFMSHTDAQYRFEEISPKGKTVG